MSHLIDTTAGVAVLDLPWAKPPLTLNQRLHYRQKAERVRTVRATARDLAERVGISQMIRPALTLVWLVDSRHRRDTDNVVPTLKALADGLVDAGVAVDDTPEFMHKAMPIIHYAKGHRRAPGMYLVVWEAGGETADELRALQEVKGL